MKRQDLLRVLPKYLLALLIAIAVSTVFLQANSYGITSDEPLQNAYGKATLAWYETLGRNQSFLHFDPTLHMPEHGPAFEVIVALAQQVFGSSWQVRAVVTGLSGVVGIVAMAGSGFELAGWWGAFLAALGLWLYPRFFGAIFNNPKDIPFATSTALVLWAVLLLVRHWEEKWQARLKYEILIGLLIGFSIAIRITAIFWYPILFLFLFIPSSAQLKPQKYF